MNIAIPELSLVILIGPDSAAKREFAARNFKPDEIHEPDLPIIEARLEAGKLTVVDAPNESVDERAKFHTVARHHCVEPVAFLFDFARGMADSARTALLGRRLKALDKEGFHRIGLLDSEQAAASAAVSRERLPQRRPELTGPFDIIGDVHGCFEELEELLTWLGYLPASNDQGERVYRHPQGRRVTFLGDLVDRGPRVIECVRLAMAMCRDGALCVPGNHDVKFSKKLAGHDVHVAHGLQASLDQVNALPQRERERFTEDARRFIDQLPHHYVLDGGKLVVAHAGMKEEMQGRSGGRTREFALYGETTGEYDSFGLPVRLNWASRYSGAAFVAYGHMAVKEAAWLNNTVCIDTGCVFGGRLSALKWPEKELVQVKARKVHWAPRKPLSEPPKS